MCTKPLVLQRQLVCPHNTEILWFQLFWGHFW